MIGCLRTTNLETRIPGRKTLYATANEKLFFVAFQKLVPQFVKRYQLLNPVYLLIRQKALPGLLV